MRKKNCADFHPSNLVFVPVGFKWTVIIQMSINYKNPLLLQPAVEVLLFKNEFSREKGLNMKWPYNCRVMKLEC